MCPKYVVCIKNGDYLASLEVRKIYRALPDDFASKHAMIRVIDESEEDYLFPSSYFIPIELSEEMEKALFANQEMHQDVLVTEHP
ncbi:MAG: hypothetical protein J4G13_03025 [Dehalococcoidia bacterium]|nr:hypothetical protein [Dehalococcoidia bacterium]